MCFAFFSLLVCAVFQVRSNAQLCPGISPPAEFYHLYWCLLLASLWLLALTLRDIVSSVKRLLFGPVGCCIGEHWLMPSVCLVGFSTDQGIPPLPGIQHTWDARKGSRGRHA